ncbi:MAG: DUF58 domain-containing protein [Spirochaetales bacterium]|nr:DUF58 domain-containing protein [Spirochaetales bacterium]
MIPVPESRLLLLLCIPLVCMVIGYFQPFFLIIGSLLDIIILFYSFFDVFTTISTKDFSLDVRTPRIFSIGRKNNIYVNLLSRCRIPLDMKIKIQIPQFWTDFTENETLILNPGEKKELILTFQPQRRGVYNIDYCYVKYKTRGKVFSIREKIKVNLVVEVFPDIKELNYFVQLVRKNKLYEIGIHKNRLQGSGTELEYLREYHKDDDSKRIEWKATTRINKPVTKVFQMETSNLITLVLDCGRLMTAEAEGLSALDYSINALLILAHIIIQMGDMLGIIAFSDRIIGELPPQKGKNSINKVSHFVTKLKPEFVESNYRLILSYLRTRIKKRSLIIFFSDMIDDINYSLFSNSFSFLNKRHITLFILLRDTILMKNAENAPDSILDLFVSTSATEMFMRRKEAIAKLKHSGISVLDVLPTQVTPGLVDKYLEIKARNYI